MLSFCLLVTAAAVLPVFTATTPVFGEAPARIRGTITAIDDASITLQERDGHTYRLETGSYTTYADVVPSTIAEIKVNDFVGAAVKGPPASMVAVELAIVPKNMRAGRISYYAWDPLPDPTAKPASGTIATNMTNGLVANVSTEASQRTATNMTGGIVSNEKGSAVGRMLTITYDGGSKSFRIAVPPNAPIVRYRLADRSAIAVGSTVMIKTKAGNQADLVTIGKGVTPPM